jgi:hypothetical protein
MDWPLQRALSLFLALAFAAPLLIAQARAAPVAKSLPVQFTYIATAAGVRFTHSQGNQGTSINREEFGPGVCVADLTGTVGRTFIVNGHDQLSHNRFVPSPAPIRKPPTS